MSFLDKIRSLVEPPPPPPGTVEFPYGCPACAERIFGQVSRSSEGWQADKVKTNAVRGVPPFSYKCQKCNSEYKVSHTELYGKEYYHWRKTFSDRTGVSFHIRTCSACNTVLSLYERQGVGEEGRDHFWCMACGDERYTGEVTENFQVRGPYGISYGPPSSTTHESQIGLSASSYSAKKSKARIFDKLVTELISIGQDAGYTSYELSAGDNSVFNEDGKNIRALQIGKMFNKLGKTREAITRVQEELGSDQAEDLKSVWHSL